MKPSHENCNQIKTDKIDDYTIYFGKKRSDEDIEGSQSFDNFFG